MNHEFTYSGYSSDANINSQANKLSEAAIKSNSITQASKVNNSEFKVFNTGSPAVAWLLLAHVVLFGPTALSAFPVERTTP